MKLHVVSRFDTINRVVKKSEKRQKGPMICFFFPKAKGAAKAPTGPLEAEHTKLRGTKTAF